MSELYDVLISWYMEHMNYWTVAGLMTIESSFIPFPSEIVIPPAAWKAAQGELNIYLVVLAGSIGALAGALVNYYIARSLGRMLVYKFAETRFAKLCMINAEKVEKAEAYFVKNGNTSTLIGRLVPGIRQLISLPAGLAKMKMAPFIIYTTLGATTWNIILAVLGYFLYSQKELLNSYYLELTIALLALGVLYILYLVWRGMKKRKKD